MKLKCTSIKLFVTSVISFGIFVTLGIGQVSALSSICSGGASAGTNVSGSAYCQTQAITPTTNPILNTLNLATNIITGIAGFVAVVMIIISGLQMVSSSGNSEKISHARDAILYASIGLVVIALARIIILFIVNKIV